MDKVSTWLLCDGDAEERARFYTALIPGSAIVDTMRAPTDNPSGPSGAVLTVEFTLAGRSFVTLNGPAIAPTEAVSLQVACADQAEVDRYWDALVADGGAESRCGWCRDRWGMSWQIAPTRLLELMRDPDAGPAAMQAMLKMRRIDLAALERAISS